LGKVDIDAFVVVEVVKDALIVERLKSAIRARCASSMSTFSCLISVPVSPETELHLHTGFKSPWITLREVKDYHDESAKVVVRHQPSLSEDIAFQAKFHGTVERQMNKSG